MAGFDWVVSVLAVAGFLLGLVTEHLLHILGFEHSHAGHTHVLRDNHTDAVQVGASANEVQGEMSFSRFPAPPVPLQSTAVSTQQGALHSTQLAYPQLMISGSNFGSDKNAATSDVESAVSSGHGHDHSMRTGIITNILVGDFFHNLFDGIAIGSAFLSCGPLGWLVTASVIVHELPQELSDFIILVRAGLSVWSALACNLASSMSCIIGAIVAVLVGQNESNKANLNFNVGRILAFSAGILLYVGAGLASEVPRIKGRNTSLIAWLTLCFGVVINGLLKMWDVHCDECGLTSHSGHAH